MDTHFITYKYLCRWPYFQLKPAKTKCQVQSPGPRQSSGNLMLINTVDPMVSVRLELPNLHVLGYHYGLQSTVSDFQYLKTNYLLRILYYQLIFKKFNLDIIQTLGTNDTEKKKRKSVLHGRRVWLRVQTSTGKVVNNENSLCVTIMQWIITDSLYHSTVLQICTQKMSKVTVLAMLPWGMTG